MTNRFATLSKHIFLTFASVFEGGLPGLAIRALGVRVPLWIFEGWTQLQEFHVCGTFPVSIFI